MPDPDEMRADAKGQYKESLEEADREEKAQSAEQEGQEKADKIRNDD